MLINPCFLYIITWSVGLYLYTLYYTDLFIPLSSLTFNYIVFSMIAVFSAWVLFFVVRGSMSLNRKIVLREFSSFTEKKIKYLLYIWVILSLCEVIYFQDLPILSLFGLGSMSYIDFGIPSLHGFLNSILLSLSMYTLYRFLLSHEYKYLIYYGLFALAPLLAMNRGGMTSLLIQGCFVLLVFRKFRFRSYVFLLMGGIIFAFAFAWLGEARNMGGGEDIYAVFQISDDYPEWLSRDFIWVYMYITGSLNNIQNTMMMYADVSFMPQNVLYSLLPSIIRNSVEAPQTIELVVDAFNVSSFMPNYLSAFGVYGSLIFYFFASLVPMYVYYMFLHTGKHEYGFVLVIFLHSIALSIFSEFFFIQVYMFQIILQFFVFRKVQMYPAGYNNVLTPVKATSH